MNRNFAVKLLLILAIVLQSFNAVSALLDAHQVDAQHLETVHDHASDKKSVAENQVTGFFVELQNFFVLLMFLVLTAVSTSANPQNTMLDIQPSIHKFLTFSRTEPFQHKKSTANHE